MLMLNYMYLFDLVFSCDTLSSFPWPEEELCVAWKLVSLTNWSWSDKQYYLTHLVPLISWDRRGYNNIVPSLLSFCLYFGLEFQEVVIVYIAKQSRVVNIEWLFSGNTMGTLKKVASCKKPVFPVRTLASGNQKNRSPRGGPWSPDRETRRFTCQRRLKVLNVHGLFLAAVSQWPGQEYKSELERGRTWDSKRSDQNPKGSAWWGQRRVRDVCEGFVTFAHILSLLCLLSEVSGGRVCLSYWWDLGVVVHHWSWSLLHLNDGVPLTKRGTSQGVCKLEESLRILFLRLSGLNSMHNPVLEFQT